MSDNLRDSMTEPKKTDLSKLDWSRLTLPEWGGEAVTVSTTGPLESNALLFLSCGDVPFAFICRQDNVWRYVRNHTWANLVVAKTYTDRVDAFIAAEAARLEKEAEGANWVTVPWQDVEWLLDLDANVQWAFNGGENYNTIPGRSAVVGIEDKLHNNQFRADRRTFPAGYDPAKPRWVEVDWTQVERLDKAGCQLGDVADKSYGYRPRKPGFGAGKRDWCYAVDVHTLPPGVPLHSGPEAPTKNDVGPGKHVKPRPCSREFALAHPEESEWKYHGEAFRMSFRPMSTFATHGSGFEDAELSFRTTAPEEPTTLDVRHIMLTMDGVTWSGNLERTGGER